MPPDASVRRTSTSAYFSSTWLQLANQLGRLGGFKCKEVAATRTQVVTFLSHPMVCIDSRRVLEKDWRDQETTCLEKKPP